MTRERGALYCLLAVVAVAAAVLSFSALRDLALMCGFSARLAWLLPVTIDAGAAAASLVWLGQWSAAGADRYARALALLLLGGSVAGNALGHALQAYAVAPPWWVVVAVSAIAPAVAGAVIHLAVLVGLPVAAAAARPANPQQASRPTRRVVVPTAPKPQPAASTPTVAAPKPATPSAAGRRAAGLAHARENWPVTGSEIALAVGVSKGEGDRIRAMVKAEREVAS